MPKVSSTEPRDREREKERGRARERESGRKREEKKITRERAEGKKEKKRVLLGKIGLFGGNIGLLGKQLLKRCSWKKILCGRAKCEPSLCTHILYVSLLRKYKALFQTTFEKFTCKNASRGRAKGEPVYTYTKM